MPDSGVTANESAGRGVVARLHHTPGRALVYWFAALCATVFVVPTYLRLGTVPWRLAADQEMQAWYWSLATLVSGSGLTLFRMKRGPKGVWTMAALVLLPWVAAAAVLFPRADVQHSRIIAAWSLAFGLGGAVVPLVLGRLTSWAAAGTGAILGVLMVVAPRAERSAAGNPPGVTGPDLLQTFLLPVAVTRYTSLIPTESRGGAMAAADTGYIVVTPDGAFVWLAFDRGTGRLRSAPLPIRAPIARDGVVLDSSGTLMPLLRVTGLVLADRPDGGTTIFVAHETWRPRDRCLVLQVSALDVMDVHTAGPSAPWRVVYATNPCIVPGSAFDPFESGGRLRSLAAGDLLLSVGDYGLNVDARNAHAQRMDSDYGKTLRISPSGTRRVYSLGHRNPQGLAVALDGRIWATEHGPRGGDEINLLTEGSNYGWPLVTYGTDYAGYRWRGGDPPRHHGVFTEPALVFSPGVAISSVIEVQSPAFDDWRGDLLIGTLRAEMLLRARISGNRIMSVEYLDVGAPVRDLAEGADGRILLWSDGGDVVVLEPARGVLEGAILFEACAFCHHSNGRGTARGPSLKGLFDRRVASSSFTYSGALRALGGRWTDERLDAFLRNPGGFVPGTTMRSPGIADSSARATLRQYVRLLAGTFQP